jgi:hypothetical protein
MSRNQEQLLEDPYDVLTRFPTVHSSRFRGSSLRTQPCERDANTPGPISVQSISVDHKIDTLLTIWFSVVNMLTPPAISNGLIMLNMGKDMMRF